jgi:hypothetical protein
VLVDPGSDEALRTIKKWSRSCLDLHKECQQEEQSTLPTRVLDLEPVEPRVWETNGFKGTYIALSHCWGTEKGLTATRLSMPMLEKRINVGALLKTFRDAIFVARALGVRYLWVDSLCIIQDSVEDWTRESANMKEVYRNSFLTIVVAGSASDAHGFLGPRQHNPTVERGASESDKRIAFRRHPHSGPPEPLYSRAWTFQERFLSPRMVKFKRQELEWHCRARKICECGHYGDHYSKMVDHTRLFRFAYHGLSAGTLKEVHEIWRHSIVQKYSGLSLTKPSDRLPALSGLASLARERIPDANYLAGLWESDLIQGLQWYCKGEAARFPLVPFQEHISRAQQRRLTWSWVSVPGPVAYPLPRPNLRNVTRLVNSSIRILQAESNATGSDPHGELRSGELVIRALTTRAQIYETCSRDGKISHYAFRIDAPSPTTIRCNTGNTGGPNVFYPDEQAGARSDSNWARQTALQKLGQTEPEQKVPHPFSLRHHILVLEIEKGIFDETTSCRCLVLEESFGSSGKRLVVKRIGYMVCSPDHIWPITTEPVEFTIV